MKSLSLQEKEQQFISTLICCNNELNHDYKNKVKYNKNMIQLYESVVGIDNIDYSEITKHNLFDIKNFRGNKYAYFNSVNKLIESTNDNMIYQLNETAIFENDDMNILSFKDKLKDVITSLSISNDFNVLDSLSPTITKIKLFTRKPVYVYGFDLFNNQELLKELNDNFGLSLKSIYSIIFDKSNKQMLFVSSGRIISYLLKDNLFDDYNKIWLNDNIENIDKINDKNYFEFIKENINNNIIELYKNYDNLDFKFTDNLYNDSKKTEENLKELMYRKSNLFIKS